MAVLKNKLMKLTILGGDSIWVSADCIDFMYRTSAVNCQTNEVRVFTRLVTTHEGEEFFVKETPEEIEKMWTDGDAE